MSKARELLPALLLSAACANNPLAVEGQRAATPEEVARNVGWYRQVAQCAELPDASGRVHWWYVDRIDLEGARSPYGVTRGDDILIVPSNPPPGQSMKGVVHRHESLHHLLWQATGDADGGHGHPLWDQCINQRKGE